MSDSVTHINVCCQSKFRGKGREGGNAFRDIASREYIDTPGLSIVVKSEATHRFPMQHFVFLH